MNNPPCCRSSVWGPLDLNPPPISTLTQVDLWFIYRLAAVHVWFSEMFISHSVIGLHQSESIVCSRSVLLHFEEINQARHECLESLCLGDRTCRSSRKSTRSSQNWLWRLSIGFTFDLSELTLPIVILCFFPQSFGLLTVEHCRVYIQYSISCWQSRILQMPQAHRLYSAVGQRWTTFTVQYFNTKFKSRESWEGTLQTLNILKTLKNRKQPSFLPSFLLAPVEVPTRDLCARRWLVK